MSFFSLGIFVVVLRFVRSFVTRGGLCVGFGGGLCRARFYRSSLDCIRWGVLKQKFQSGSHTQKKRRYVETLCALAMRSSTTQKRASSSSSFSFSSLFWVVVSLCDSREKEKKNKECVLEMRTKERDL